MTDRDERALWQQAGAVFSELVDLPAADRAARLEALRDDAELLGAVETLLSGEAAAEQRLPAPGFGLDVSERDDRDPLHLVGRNVAHFHVEAYVARGGMGLVYRARDLRIERSVALKFLLPLRLVSPSSREFFLAEARSAGALDHANLCPLFEIGESDAGPFLVMPWYEGETLQARLARTGALPLDELLSVSAQCAAGLAHAHAAGVAHRDIKPGNVMLLADGRVRILDFGLATWPSQRETERDRMGTVAYMAPELRPDSELAGDSTATGQAADLWALGLLCAEMATGKLPSFSHDSDWPPVIETVRRPLPSIFTATLQSLLNPVPSRRGPNAAEVAERMASARDALAMAARRQRERRLTLATATVAVVAMAASLLLWLGVIDLPHRGLLPANNARLVIADFRSTGPDSTLGPFVASVLRAQLSRSRVASVLPQARIDSLRRRMLVAPSARLDPALARALAQRDGAIGVIEGEVGSNGTALLVTVRLTDARSGTELGVFNARADQAGSDLLPALERLGRDLRERIGESRRELRAEPPLPEFTTRSTEALRAVLDARRLNPRDARLASLALRRAIAADSNFAYAWLLFANGLPSAYSRTAARDSAVLRAYRGRAQLSLFEAAQAEGFYWRELGLDRQRAIDAFESALARDSSLLSVAQNLADTFNDTRQFARTVDLLTTRQAAVMAARPQSITILAYAFIGMGRLDAADSALQVAKRRYPQLIGSSAESRVRTMLALAQAHYDDPSLSVGDERIGAWLARVRGNLSDAERLEQIADSQLTQTLMQNGIAYRLDYAVALRQARTELSLRRRPARALAIVDSVFAARPPRQLTEPQHRIDAVRLAALYAMAGQPARTTAIITQVESDCDSPLARRALSAVLEDARGEIALAEGRTADALRHFRQSDLGAEGLPIGACTICVLPKVARAFEAAGATDSALVTWSRYVSTPSLHRIETDQWYWTLAHERLSALGTRGPRRAR